MIIIIIGVIMSNLIKQNQKNIKTNKGSMKLSNSIEHMFKNLLINLDTTPIKLRLYNLNSNC